MPIELERAGGTAVLTVNRPDALNALDLSHAAELRDRLSELAGDQDVRAVLVTGAGEKAFVAGADIKYMQGLGVLEARRWAELGHGIGELLETMPKPTVAAVNGYALGGGCEVALACDIRLASTRARLGQPEVNLGIFPGWGGSVRLARTTSLGFAKELILTGRMVEAEEALARGLVNAVVEPEELMPQGARALWRLRGEESRLAGVRQGSHEPRTSGRPPGEPRHRGPALLDPLRDGGSEGGDGRLLREARARVSRSLNEHVGRS